MSDETKKKKPGPAARKKARELAAQKPAPLQDTPLTKAARPPRVKPYVERASSEVLHVPLSDHDAMQKLNIMLAIVREKEQLEADFEASKADFKKQIKDKAAEIVEVQQQLQTRQEKREVPLLIRYYLGESRKVVLNASTKKKVRDEPMTPAEKREVSASQPELLPVGSNGHGSAPAPVAAPAAASTSTPAAEAPKEQQTELPAGGEDEDTAGED